MSDAILLPSCSVSCASQLLVGNVPACLHATLLWFNRRNQPTHCQHALKSCDLCSTDALPTLEVIANEVYWDLDMPAVNAEGGGINGTDTFVAGFAHIAIRTASLQIHSHGPPHGRHWTPSEAFADSAFISVVRYAPPTMRTCSLGPVLHSASGAQCWPLELDVHDCEGRRYRFKSKYESAAELAEGLAPFVAEAGIRLRLDSHSQGVHLTRMPPTST